MMGGDFGPEVTVKGLSHALDQLDNVHANLFGNENEIRNVLDKYPSLNKKLDIIHTENFVPMDAKPADAIRRIGKDSSMWLSIDSCAKKESDVVLSAGNTGALMALSKLILKTVDGIERPAITALWPNPKGNSVVLDLGANIDISANQLVQFGIMGYAYALCVLKNENPKVAILNIGHEEMKGSNNLQEAYDKLSNIFSSNFIGFVEGDDLSKGTSDVIITDGFTGNVALKTAEGIAKLIAHYLSDSLKSSLTGKLGMFIAQKSLKSLKEKIDPRGNNGGFFLGLNGLVVKSHGGTDFVGFSNAIQFSVNLARSDISKKIADLIGENI